MFESGDDLYKAALDRRAADERARGITHGLYANTPDTFLAAQQRHHADFPPIGSHAEAVRDAARRAKPLKDWTYEDYRREGSRDADPFQDDWHKRWSPSRNR